ADVALESQSGDEGSQPVNYYDWLPLASALVELRSGRDVAAAVKELRDYCNLSSDNTPTSQEDESNTASNTGIPQHCLKAYALLVAEKRDAEAEALLYDAYRKASISRNASDASLAGLAEIEARRGHAEEASRLLRRIVERSTDNQLALRLAAETAGK